MNVVLATSSFKGGGITSYAHELISCYSKDNNFSVIIGDDSQSPINQENVTVYKYDCSNLSFTNICNIVNLINEEIKPDIVIASCAKVISLALPYLNDTIRVVAVSHSLKYIEADLAAFNYQYSDVVIALSGFNKAYLDKTFKIKDKNKVKVVYNFVREYPLANELLEKKKQRKTVNIVFPGGAAASKAPEIVVQVVNRLVDTDLEYNFYWLGNTQVHLIRYFPLFAKKDIKNVVKRDSRIIFTGKVSRSEAEEIIANADVFLSPSRREGCPMSLIEAMRIGVIPIVADFDNANKEIIKDSQNGFVVNRNDIERFVSVIKEIILHKNHFYSIYDKSVETYYQELCYDTWKTKMDEYVFQGACSHKKRGKTICKRNYRKDLRRFRFMQQKDTFMFLIQEPLRLLFKIQSFKKH